MHFETDGRFPRLSAERRKVFRTAAERRRTGRVLFAALALLWIAVFVTAWKIL